MKLPVRERKGKDSLMKTKLKYVILVVPVLLFSGFFKGDSDLYFQISKSIDIFGRIYKEVSFNYVEEVNPEEFMYSAINGMLNSLDPYTVLYDEKRKSDVDFLTNGKYGGIGGSIGIRNDSIVVVEVFEGYSAHRQGLRIGDVILKINETEITPTNFDEVSNLVKGEPGSEVKLTIKRLNQSEATVFSIVREEVKIKNVTYYGFTSENSDIGYIKLSGFTRTAGDELKEAISDLQKLKKIESLILDLRGNPGGLLEAAVDVSEKFLKKGQLIVTVIGRDSSNIKNYYSQEEPIYGDKNLIVLIDNGTASAAEIVAGAIQDHDRGLIIGTSSFGKGLVQTVVPLSYNNSLKITTSKYHTPSGRSIQKINYSKDNKVFKNHVETGVEKFNTDNQRIVFSSGGIHPDSTVINDTNSTPVKSFLAKGIFFDFADKIFNSETNKNYYDFNFEILYKDFLNYVDNKKINIELNSESEMEKLINTSKSENLSDEIIADLKKIKTKISTLKSSYLTHDKNLIINGIKNELASRYLGNSGRIKEMLNDDKQYKTAIELLKQDQIYTAMLSSNLK